MDELDVAGELKARFENSQLFFLDQYEVQDDGRTALRSDEDERRIESFQVLLDTFDAVPPELMADAGKLRLAQPEAFEKWLIHGLRVVGYSYTPESATQFVEMLNHTIRTC